MKYQQLLAFEKHLEQAAKLSLSRVFLVASSCPYEQRKILEKIVSAIRVQEKQIDVRWQEGGERPLAQEIKELNTLSLLQGKQILCLQGIEKIKKHEFPLLVEYVVNPSPFSYLLLSATSLKGLQELYTRGKKELIVCDLSEEKPWDRKNRIKRMLVDRVAKEGKRIQEKALELLMEHIGLNLPSLEQEISKWITYGGQRCEITLQDAQLLCAAPQNTTLWKSAETIVWNEASPQVDDLLDVTTLLSLCAQLRIQLQQGLTLSVLLEKKIQKDHILHYFPTIKLMTLEKMIYICNARGNAFFKQALNCLFEVELMAKNSSFEPLLLLDLFLTKITFLKQHAIPAS